MVSQDAAADALLATLTSTYLYGRHAARVAGATRLAGELELLYPGTGELIRLSRFAALEDLRFAQRAARGYVIHWRRSLAVATGMELEAIAAATAAQDSRLALGAVTETATAFNVERSQALKQFAREQPVLAETLVKVWDSALEKNTCDVCERAHGTWVYLDQDFPLGEPGDVHPRCRCTEQVIPVDWVDADQRAA